MGTDITMAVEVRIGDRWKWLDGEHVDVERSYDLFGLLANVRNGTWGDPVPVIAAPRGLPADADARLLVDVPGEHSFSHLTLAELLAYDWGAEVSRDLETGEPTAGTRLSSPPRGIPKPLAR